MERNLENQVQVLYTDRERYEAVLHNHRRVHEQAKEECEREKDLASTALRQAQSESRHRVEGMEKEKLRIEETRRSELAQGHEYVDHRQQRVEDMEHDLERVRSRLVDMENSLGFLRQECYHEEREGLRIQRELEEEVRLMDSQLERSRRDDTTLAKQWEAQRFRTDQERRGVQQSFGEPVPGTSSPGSGRRLSSEPVTAR
ncbi:RPP25L [Symbiodinium pilosum]|uniref:RPP25L protein n=1 Tax=Symbiodinium pilosum TaxID=2952 RepID=A0A812TH99_SYMPI|nr:RPP25L [Symbiodinium pilosum]